MLESQFESQVASALDVRTSPASPALPPGALVVTGAGRGIGAEIARQGAGAGRPVVLVYRSGAQAAAAVVAQIEQAGGRAISVGADVGCESEMERVFAAADDEFGGVCGLVNNAVYAGTPTALAQLSMAELDAVLRTNVRGAFLCSQLAARRMSTDAAGAGGGIVSMSSAVAVKTGAPGSWVHFAASKAALETMSLGLARELASVGVRVNVVRCGLIDTESRLAQPQDYRRRLLDQVPLQRYGTPSEVAQAVLWLLSDQAAYVTGATLDVAGGL